MSNQVCPECGKIVKGQGFGGHLWLAHKLKGNVKECSLKSLNIKVEELEKAICSFLLWIYFYNAEEGIRALREIEKKYPEVIKALKTCAKRQPIDWKKEEEEKEDIFPFDLWEWKPFIE